MFARDDAVWKMQSTAPAICPRTDAVTTDEFEFIASMTTPILVFNGFVYHLPPEPPLPFVSPIKCAH